jgi:D-tyrosyl-tRNA(Tyr) deacylase|tara:strand:+ start:146 stop:598 length:453 start_codon:yes stop_codon:yes gene_type:complete
LKVVIQRVSQASVTINSKLICSINTGLLILLGIEQEDDVGDVSWLTKKISNLRIFSDLNGKMNLSIKELDAQIIVVSQFTLHAKTKKGNRPSYINAANPQHAILLYENFLDSLSSDSEKNIFSGEFGADMKVSLINDGPVTIIIDTKDKE